MTISRERQLKQRSNTLPLRSQDTVVMVIWIAHLPEDPAIPIAFKHRAAFPRLAADKAI
jgi:hypothetical protein